jgi:ubiquinone/menaquinone biosynthesis C-methylase UbiE
VEEKLSPWEKVITGAQSRLTRENLPATQRTMITNIKLIQKIYDATWGRWFFAGGYDRFLREAEAAGLSEHRRQVVSQAKGKTLELATGTGLNLPHYGGDVTELVLSEPYPHMITELRRTVSTLGRKAAIVEACAEQLPFPDESFDTVVGTMILCTAEKPELVLTEAARVLRKGGQYLFLEHIRNPDPRIALRQDLLQPGWYLFGNGCHCNRDTIQTLNSSPLVVEELQHGRIPRIWKIVEAMITGRARRRETPSKDCGSATHCGCA